MTRHLHFRKCICGQNLGVVDFCGKDWKQFEVLMTNSIRSEAFHTISLSFEYIREMNRSLLKMGQRETFQTSALHF